VHCSTRGGQPVPGELSHQERLRVLREACDLELFELRLLGGDPLVRIEETTELLTEANARSVKKALVYTSAVEENPSWMAGLVSLQPIRVSAEASIYSASAPTHDTITLKRGSFDRLLANSRAARRIGFDLNWNFVWMKPNFDDLEPVLALASQIGIARVRVLRLMLNGRARDNQSSLELTPEMASRCKQIISDLTRKFAMVELAHSKPLAFQLADAFHHESDCCSAGGAQLVVQADGVVFPCIGFKDSPALQVGNVREHNLQDILLRSRSMPFRRVSDEFKECPAILFQKQPNLIQVSLMTKENRYGS
jgi:pyrroloquinoline quinone biosynthesis protein E